MQLCVAGLTNDGIAHKLGLSVGTVNTYWLRIKLKVGGSSRTDTIVKIINERAENALRMENSNRQAVLDLVAKPASGTDNLRFVTALLYPAR